MAGLLTNYGDGSGFGYGDNHVERIGEVAGRLVLVHRPFPVVSVGCQLMSVSEWQKAWREVANTHSVSVDEAEVEEMIKKAMKAIGD